MFRNGLRPLIVTLDKWRNINDNYIATLNKYQKPDTA